MSLTSWEMPHPVNAGRIDKKPHIVFLVLDHREGEAFLVAAAGPSPETEEERDHSHGRGTISLLVPFPGLAVAPGQMRGNKTLRRSCVQEVVRSEYGEYVQNIVLFWNFIKLGAFLKCFSC